MHLVHKLAIWSIGIYLASPLQAAALPIGYNDMGRTTLDTHSGIEWLDVTETVNRTYFSVRDEIIDSSQPLGAEGWRYATRGEFQQLISNFFSIGYFGGLAKIDINSLVLEFNQTFGDTWQIWCSHTQCSPNGIVGNTDGMLGEVAIDPLAGNPELYQGIVTNPASIPQNAAGYVEDHAYRSASTESWGVGSWLVRGAHNIPEPSTIALFLFSFALLALLRRRDSAPVSFPAKSQE